MMNTTSNKPILFNGYEVEDGVIVVKRLEKVFFTEIYLLSNEKYLYLFTNLKQNEIIDNKNRYKVRNLKLGGETYLAIITDDYSQENVTDIMEDLTTQKGFDCVAGMDKLKNNLINDVINPLRDPEKYKKYKVSIPNGILLFGPPGCGKTFIIRKLAEELGYNFIELKHSDIGSPYIHESTNKIGKVFEIARLKAPSIVFIDELSGLVPRREELDMGSMYKQEEVDEFLIQLNDAADSGVLVVGATNFPEKIDKALLRSGRMDKLIYVPPPDVIAREELFKMSMSGRPQEEEIDFKKLAKLTEYYVSSDIELIVDKAARVAVKEEKPISQVMLMEVIANMPPSISIEELEYFNKFEDKERW